MAISSAFVQESAVRPAAEAAACSHATKTTVDPAMHVIFIVLIVYLRQISVNQCYDISAQGLLQSGHHVTLMLRRTLV